MIRLLLGSIAAGLIAALVFVSAMTGSQFLRLVLFMITPLPIFLVGIGIGWRAAGIAALAGGLAILAVTGNAAIAGVFTLSQMIPGVMLCYLAQLSRTFTDPQNPSAPALTQWYPVGRIILWSAALGVAVSVIFMLILANDVEGLKAALRGYIEKIIEAQLQNVGEGQTVKPEDLDTITQVTLQLLPAATAISAMVSLLFNLWLAGRITLASGALRRPWPDIPAFEFPAGTAIAFAGALGLSFLGGTPGLLGSAIAGALYFAYVLLGLAIIHHVTRSNPWRPMILWLVYLALLFTNTALTPLFAVIGLTERFSPLSRDFSKTPPSGPAKPPGPGNSPPPD